jgi:pimeloyl-ACP methyl ester carboxylesterase
VALPGFGRDLSRPRQVRVADWLAAAREAWIETRQGARQTTLIGFSMGAAVALRLAAAFGMAPDRLILLARILYRSLRCCFLSLRPHRALFG